MMLARVLLFFPLLLTEGWCLILRASLAVSRGFDIEDAVWDQGDNAPTHPLILRFFLLRRNLRWIFFEPEAEFSSLEDLQRQEVCFEFVDDRFVDNDFPVPPILVVDGFYDDPIRVRDLARSIEYVEVARNWYASALWVTGGRPIEGDRYFHGFRFNSPSVRHKLSEIIQSEIDEETWNTLGDGWNGAFQYRTARYRFTRTDGLHHHWKALDAEYGWTGIVYLQKDPLANTGTSIWRSVESGKCIASTYGPFFERNLGRRRWRKVFHVEPKFNRLVLLRSDVFHMGSSGYGDSVHNARLIQTFFFSVRKGASLGDGGVEAPTNAL